MAVAAVAIVAWLLVTQPFADTPERHVARYLDATSRGDLAGALREWSIYATHTNVPATDPVLTRRNDLTDDLVIDRAGGRFQIVSTEWWRTCCEPAPTTDQRNAGLARVHVTATGASGRTYRLIFDVWTEDLTYWGDAAGSPPRDWRLYEVREEDQTCLFGGSAYGCARASN